MDLGSRRNKIPLWPPNKHGAYQNLSSTEDISLQETPHTGTSSMSGAHKSLLTPNLAPSPYSTSDIDSKHPTPYLGTSPNPLQYDSERPKQTWFGYGWRGGAKIAFGSTVIALLVNTILLIYMVTGFEKMDGFPIIYRGTCEQAEQQNTIWHLVINGLSTALLAASNYAMQLLVAPTRANIDRAHEKGHWLDIGIPSLRNLRFVNKKRKLFWVALAISSIPLHLIYNSTFYAAIATNNYNVLYATEDFVNGGGYDTTRFPSSAAQNISGFQANATNWVRLENPDCIQQYGHDFITKYRNVINIVQNVTAASDDSLLEVVLNELPPGGTLSETYDSFAWICNDTMTTNKTGVTDRNSAGFVPCAAQISALEKIADTWWKSGGYHINHCLAEAIPPDCHLHFAPHLMGPVIMMNIVKVLVIFWVAFRMVDVPLVTLGDAVESFIKHPDPTTSGMCLITGHDAEKTFSKKASGMSAPAPQQFDPVRHRFSKIVTKRQWGLLIALVTAMTIGLMFGLIFGIKTLAPPTLANAWSIGLGTIQTQNLVLAANLPQLGATAVLVTALLANSPQLLLSFLYMIYNTIFTLLYVGEDWDRFGAHQEPSRRTQLFSKKETHRPLRVSDPKGSQRSTHFLNLPFRYALVLISVSGLIHWLASQSFYLANISVIPRDGTLPRQDEITTVAFAPQGMIWLCVVGILMVFVLLANGMRKFGGQMVIVGSNSAAISAACHLEQMPEKRRREIVLRKVAWGKLPSSGDSRLPNFENIRRSTTFGSKASDEMHMGMGLGIKSDDRAYTTEQFRDQDLESNGYQALSHGQAEFIDLRGVATSSGVGHCSFSDGFVFKPAVGKLYA